MTAPHEPQLEQLRALTLFAGPPDTVRAVRKMVRSALDDWALGVLAEDAQLCVSELVANVIQYAIPDESLAVPDAPRRIDVTLRKWPQWLFIGVTDEDHWPPTFPLEELFSPELASGLPEAVLSEGGRGLLIVQQLADGLWWSPEEQGGKTVYFRFDLVERGLDGQT
ncbi:ATP-binding protein [Streptomyces chattanoogensis]|uniref:ATP-binding protein n=1 Tax=Streptomyces chattanoogensis TaxID=66876 RepID=UPI0036C3240B